MLQILIHSPHRPEKDISYLNINQKITALLAGKAIPNDEKDILVIGTVGSVLAYNVDLNSDLFFKEVSNSFRNCTYINTIEKLGGTRLEYLMHI